MLVTGASGYLAKALLPIVAAKADVVGVARSASGIDTHTAVGSIIAQAVNISDKGALISVVDQHRPDAIIHCAACNPGGSDEDMHSVNDLGTLHVAEAAKAAACRLVAVSTDTVLSGSEAPYAEDAKASPLPENAYAVSKARAEAHIRSMTPDAVTVRTSLIYGTKHMDRGTAGFVERLNSGSMLSLFNDVIRQPVHDVALANALCSLALDNTQVAGVMSLVGDEAMSRYTFGIRMLDYWGIDYEGRVESRSGAGIPGLPMNVSVEMKIARTLGFATPGVGAVLAAAQ